MTDPIKYIDIRIGQLNDELAKTNMEETVLILSKSIYELELVNDLLKRNRTLSMSPYSDNTI
tara:strand:+ start:191 stop:376 length:186 start_codon:yes stop_codon:yes gene_type:complete